jgi:Tfp pilus assembly ATPase PilU
MRNLALFLLLLLFYFPQRYAKQLVIMCNLNIKVWIAKRIKRTQDGRFKNRTAPLLHNFCNIHSNRCVRKFLQVIKRSSML